MCGEKKLLSFKNYEIFIYFEHFSYAKIRNHDIQTISNFIEIQSKILIINVASMTTVKIFFGWGKFRFRTSKGIFICNGVDLGRCFRYDLDALSTA